MYVLEVPHADASYDPDYLEIHYPSYVLSGDASEIGHFQEAVCAAALGAVSLRSVGLNEAYNLINELAVRPEIIHYPGNVALQKVMSEWATNSRSRMVTCLKAAAEGQLSAAALVREAAVIDEFDDWIGSACMNYVTAEGYDASMTTTGMEAKFRDIDDLPDWYGEGSIECKVADGVGADTFVEQYTRHDETYHYLNPTSITSHHRHKTMGKRLESGEFMPIVTVLAKEHPVRDTPEPEM